MSGRPVHLLAAAAIAVTASVVSISAASAGCYSCGSSYTYSAPVAYYTAPVVYSYSYAAPAAYAAPCNCGSSYGYAAPSAPMYVVNQGPAYTQPVMVNAEPTPAPAVSYGYGSRAYGYGSAYPMYSEGAPRWHRRHFGYGYRGYRAYGQRDYGYRGFGYRAYGNRGFGYQRYRYGAVVPGMRYSMRHPMVGRPMMGPGGMYRPRMMPMVGPGGIYRRHGMPGFVQPMRHATGAVPPHHPMGGMPPRQGGPMHPMMKRKMP